MIVFVVTLGHNYTVASLVGRAFPDLPECAVQFYETLFLADSVPVATYVFCDIERLAAWEARIAAERYRTMVAAGLRCLNDPAAVMCRSELLVHLHAAGVNPFSAYPADLLPQPRRFPVFVRSESTHRHVFTELIRDQASLDVRLAALRQSGEPLRGLLVVEYAAQPIAPGMWLRAGTYRVGDQISVDHTVIQDNWQVADGTPGLKPQQWFEDEADAVRANRWAETVRPAFELARIEWGRADHATFEGRQIVYEINTNPVVLPIAEQRSPLRRESLIFARRRLAAGLRAIDCADSGSVLLPRSPLGKRLRFREKATVIARP
jgi:hypothetical protein